MQLNYRGTTFTFQPATASFRPVVTVTRHLVYRGLVNTVQMPIQTTKSSKVINWRFTTPCQFASQDFSVAQA
jgi:hypothetical protein